YAMIQFVGHLLMTWFYLFNFLFQVTKSSFFTWPLPGPFIFSAIIDLITLFGPVCLFST
ncbi:hypothetical protein AAVH_26183, partial [Aphelenchoides avenae]